MSKERTEKCYLKSRHGDSYITQAQYLCELFCFLLAKREKKELRDYFWNYEPWDKIYLGQLKPANELIKEWGFGIVLATIKDPRIAYKIKSLRAKWFLKPVLIEYRNKQEVREKLAGQVPKGIESAPLRSSPRKVVGGKKSVLSILKDIEGKNGEFTK